MRAAPLLIAILVLAPGCMLRPAPGAAPDGNDLRALDGLRGSAEELAARFADALGDPIVAPAGDSLWQTRAGTIDLTVKDGALWYLEWSSDHALDAGNASAANATLRRVLQQAGVAPVDLVVEQPPNSVAYTIRQAARGIPVEPTFSDGVLIPPYDTPGFAPSHRTILRLGPFYDLSRARVDVDAADAGRIAREQIEALAAAPEADPAVRGSHANVTGVALGASHERLAWLVSLQLDARYNPHCGPLRTRVDVDAANGTVLEAALPAPFCV